MRKLRYYFGVMALGVVLFAACGQKQDDMPLPTETPQMTEEPEATATPEPTATPKPTQKPTPTPMGTNLPEGITLKNTYGKTFGNLGTCINSSQMSDLTIWELLQKHYTSITMENEMKPDAILGGSPNKISIEEAKELGYVIPENYKEDVVPKLNFYYTDRAIELCVKYDLGLRGHTLLWHAQTPTWFFRENYDRNGAVVSPEVMDARLEFYVRSVMGHVYDNENGTVVYSWDVVNEYVHADGVGWKEVYGDQGLTASYVKLAFEVADDVLKQYGIREQVSLLYNDYGTYGVTVQILQLLEFIDSDGKICDGVGMQSHLSDNDDPHPIKYISAMKSFLEAGYEVQVTELDVGSTNETYQANYYYDIMKKILQLKQEGADITGITLWGFADTNSWRASEKPLLFRTLKTPKASYYKVLEAYVDAGLYTEEQ